MIISRKPLLYKLQTEKEMSTTPTPFPVLSPTQYVVDEYSKDSAGYFFNTPVIKLLHNYYHHGSQDFENTNEYLDSLKGVFIMLCSIGFVSLSIVWFFNCFACCQNFRDHMPRYFGVFRNKKFTGKMTGICCNKTKRRRYIHM